MPDLKGNPWKPASRPEVPPRPPARPRVLRSERQQSRREGGRPSIVLILGVMLVLLGGVAAATFAWHQMELRREAIEAERARLSAYLAEREAAVRNIPALTGQQQILLRRSLNAAHVARGQALGITPIPRRDQVTDRAASDGLIEITQTPHYWVSRLTHSFPYVTADGAAALDLIGERFHARLADAGIPTFQFNVTSVLRTQEDQQRLRGVNVNAARGPSSHEFATTFDLHYQRFRYRGNAREEVSQALGPLPYDFLYDEFAREIERFYGDLATRYANRIGAALGRTLIELETAGHTISIRERLQPVYHVTVNRPLAAGQSG